MPVFFFFGSGFNILPLLRENKNYLDTRPPLTRVHAHARVHTHTHTRYLSSLLIHDEVYSCLSYQQTVFQ